MNKAVFLDRDGTIIKDMVYLSKEEDIEIIPEAVEAIKILKNNNYLVILITNQSGIARGYYSVEQFNRVNIKVINIFKEKGAMIDDTYFCPHLDNGCACRKPNPGMILDAAKEHDIDLSNSFVIGDKNTDIEAGKNAGCRTIFVLTGQENVEDQSVNPDFIAKDALDAAGRIVERGQLIL